MHHNRLSEMVQNFVKTGHHKWFIYIYSICESKIYFILNKNWLAQVPKNSLFQHLRSVGPLGMAAQMSILDPLHTQAQMRSVKARWCLGNCWVAAPFPLY